MTNKTILTSALAAVLVLAMAALALAGPGSGRGNGGSGYGPGAMYSQLTPEKQAAVDKIYEKYIPQFTELRNQMWTKHATLQAMVNGGNADEAKIGKLTADISDLRQKMWDLRDAMTGELEKETGIVMGRGNGYGPCQGNGQASCPGFDQDGRGQGRFGRGMY